MESGGRHAPCVVPSRDRAAAQAGLQYAFVMAATQLKFVITLSQRVSAGLHIVLGPPTSDQVF